MAILLSVKHLRLKLIYFFIFAAICSVAPYMSVFLSKALLIKKERIGLLLSISPFVEFFSSGIWTFLADKFNAHKHVLLICIAFAAGTLFSIPLVGKVTGFEGLLFSFLFYSLFNGGISPLVDNFTLNILKKEGKRTEYGRQRLWGTLSCGLSASLSGLLIDLIDIHVIFISYLCMIGIFTVLIISTNANDFNANQDTNNPVPLSNDNNDLELEISTNVLINPTNIEDEPEIDLLLHLLKCPRFLFFLFITLLIAIVKAICAIYLILYLSETFNASGTLMGVIVIMGISLEIVCLNYSKNIMEFFGPRNMMIAGQFALIIRVGLYGFLGKNMKPWMALPIEMLQGVMFALIWTAGVEITSSLAPDTLRATYLGIYGGTFQNISSGIGAIVGAAIYSKSPILMFQFITALAIFALGLYIVGEMFIFQDNKHKYSILNLK